MKHFITLTRNGYEVYVDLVHSSAAAHISAQPYLLGLVKEALGALKVASPFARIELDMGRSIGYDFIVETNGHDVIFYAQNRHDKQYIRFVKNGKPAATNYLSIILQSTIEGEYELRDAWVGRMNPPFPGSEDETPESRPYWSNHAHVFDRQPLQTRTITKVCPY